MSHILPVTQVRKDLLQLVDLVDNKYARVDITKNGRVKASLVSPEYLDSLEETIYSLEHSLDDIRQSEKQIAAGEFVTLDELLKELDAS